MKEPSTQTTELTKEQAEQRAREVARRLLNTSPKPLKARPKSVFTAGERSAIAGLERAAKRAMYPRR
jgi:hypothetical protein